MEELKEALVLNIKKIIKDSDFLLTMEELAELAGIGRSTLFQVLNRESSLDSTLKVAETLGLKIKIERIKE